MDETPNENNKAVDPEEWVNLHGDFLFRFALSRLRDAESAEEVVQESFVAGLRAVDQFRGRGTERAWLLGILKRKIVDYVRQRSRTSSLDATSATDEACDAMFNRRGGWRKKRYIFAPDPSESLEREEFWAMFRDCLQGLPQAQADVFSLRELDGLSSEKICKELAISPSNLWVILHRARLRLANCMKSRWKDHRVNES